MLGGESIKEREKKEKIMYILRIDNVINKDTDCKVLFIDNGGRRK